MPRVSGIAPKASSIKEKPDNLSLATIKKGLSVRRLPTEKGKPRK